MLDKGDNEGAFDCHGLNAFQLLLLQHLLLPTSLIPAPRRLSMRAAVTRMLPSLDQPSDGAPPTCPIPSACLCAECRLFFQASRLALGAPHTCPAHEGKLGECTSCTPPITAGAIKQPVPFPQSSPIPPLPNASHEIAFGTPDKHYDTETPVQTRVRVDGESSNLILQILPPPPLLHPFRYLKDVSSAPKRFSASPYFN